VNDLAHDPESEPISLRFVALEGIEKACYAFIGCLDFLYKYRMANAAAPIKPGDRARVLIANRQAKMAQSAHAYVRGNTLHFYEWLKN
jgi:hypothetical protein